MKKAGEAACLTRFFVSSPPTVLLAAITEQRCQSDDAGEQEGSRAGFRDGAGIRHEARIAVGRRRLAGGSVGRVVRRRVAAIVQRRIILRPGLVGHSAGVRRSRRRVGGAWWRRAARWSGIVRARCRRRVEIEVGTVGGRVVSGMCEGHEKACSGDSSGAGDPSAGIVVTASVGWRARLAGHYADWCSSDCCGEEELGDRHCCVLRDYSVRGLLVGQRHTLASAGPRSSRHFSAIQGRQSGSIPVISSGYCPGPGRYGPRSGNICMNYEGSLCAAATGVASSRQRP